MKPIHDAAELGEFEIVSLLISFGASINARDGLGRTALMHACKWGHLPTVELLLQDATLDINRRDWNGFSAICYAALNGHAEVVVRMVQDKRVDFEMRAEWDSERQTGYDCYLNGQSPIGLAAVEGHDEVVEELFYWYLEQGKYQELWRDLKDCVSSYEYGYELVIQFYVETKLEGERLIRLGGE